MDCLSPKFIQESRRFGILRRTGNRVFGNRENGHLRAELKKGNLRGTTGHDVGTPETA